MKAKDIEILAIPKFQAARFSAGCRTFAPVSQQATVPAVAGNFLPLVAEMAYCRSSPGRALTATGDHLE